MPSGQAIPSFDLRDAPQWYRDAAQTASRDDVGRIASFVADATENYDLKKSKRLRLLWQSVRDRVGGDTYLCAEQAQVAGEFGRYSSEEILGAMLLGFAGVDVPARFLPPDWEPQITGQDRSELSEELYWIDGLIVSEDIARLGGYHACRAAVAACHNEIKSRLALHPTSQDIYQLAMRNDGQALEKLLFAARRTISRLKHRRSHTPRRQSDEDSRIVDDEKVSVLDYSLGVITAKLVRKNHALEVLRQAMDGQFDQVAFSVKRDFIDYLRKEYADKRGGKVKGFESVDDLVGHEPAPSVRIDLNTDHALFQLHCDQLDWSEIRRGLGPSARLLRLLMRKPDLEPGEDVRAVAASLRVTPETIRNYRKQFAKKSDLVLRLIQLPTPRA